MFTGTPKSVASKYQGLSSALICGGVCSEAPLFPASSISSLLVCTSVKITPARIFGFALKVFLKL
jgi:hypothetical protein